MAASLAAFTTLETFAKVRANTLTALFAAAAFNIYYWFAAEKMVAAVSELVQATPAPPWTWAIRGAVLAVTLVWFARTLGVEKRFVALSVDMAAAAAVRLGEGAAAAIERAATRESAQVAFKPEGKRVAVQPGQTLLADHRAVRARDRVRLPDGHLWRRPGRGARGHGASLGAG